MSATLPTDRFETRVRVEFNALPYRRFGFCGCCGGWRYVARSGRGKWRCLACLDTYLATAGSRR